jgi:hypothetical protein
LLIKIFIGKVAMDIVFQRKKQNSNRVKGVEVLSILAKVKMQKRVIFYPNCHGMLKGRDKNPRGATY